MKPQKEQSIPSIVQRSPNEAPKGTEYTKYPRRVPNEAPKGTKYTKYIYQIYTKYVELSHFLVVRTFSTF